MNEKEYDLAELVFLKVTPILGIIGWISFFLDLPSPLIAVTLMETDFAILILVGWVFYVYEYLGMGLFWLFLPQLWKNPNNSEKK